MAGGFRTALFLLGLAASTGVLPPPPPPVVVEAGATPGLTRTQIARLRGERPESASPPATSDPDGGVEAPMQGAVSAAAPAPPPAALRPLAVDTITQAMQPLAQADLTRRAAQAAAQAQAREEEEALAVLLLEEAL